MILKNMIHRNINAELGSSLYKTGMMFRREAIRMSKDKQVAPEQWQIMMVLKNCGAITQKEIGKRTIQEAPAVSRSIKRMEKNGLVKIKKDRKDKRATLIYLTPKGKIVLVHTGMHLQKHISRLLKKFPDKRKKEIIELLKELRSCFPQH